MVFWKPITKSASKNKPHIQQWWKGKAYVYKACYISIHKALAGLDIGITVILRISRNFNPQGPRGPRLSIFLCVY